MGGATTVALWAGIVLEALGVGLLIATEWLNQRRPLAVHRTNVSLEVDGVDGGQSRGSVSPPHGRFRRWCAWVGVALALAGLGLMMPAAIGLAEQSEHKLGVPDSPTDAPAPPSRNLGRG